ncbi:Na+/H+ antiporter NhaA [Sphingobium sp. YC-XJ3]|uniref:Na+/H+ antiporter NhaA n=1 Tax=Sphingobium sp. TB-6 TaxID=2728850 RepID=UPI00146CB637|nr:MULTISPECIES: Na+/H+ antiporter NhaA [unclassified Sphingobium]NML91150.1 Na+/H+ antiporter NhaA [Sphingobium sp. TB-6]WDA39203.1 Na+/H+ antiporter NhaA [Sphingobium sp. YC-XJ3]
MLTLDTFNRPRSALRDFLRTEAAGGILLILAALLAMIVANSPWANVYFEVLHLHLGPLSLLHWINDALMALFFLLVGLEIKREFIDGRLSKWSDRWLPVIAAMAGMVVPAVTYLLVAGRTPGLANGWAIPAATDIAFAIGVLALLGKRAPTSLKLLLTTVAIVDDMGAVLIIALAYTKGISGLALLIAALLFSAMLILNRSGVKKLWPYLVLAAALWLAVFLSGVHATIAGVLAALAIPIRTSPGAPDDAESPLHRLEHGLHPWVAFAIVPLFGFANAGVSLAGVGMEQITGPLPLGIGAGLFLGKQVGIFASIRGAVAAGIADRPAGATWLQVYGLALICGIGFTMSLFIGGLAFSDPLLSDEVKIGVLGGSVLSAVAGYLLLRLAPRLPRGEGSADDA